MRMAGLSVGHRTVAALNDEGPPKRPRVRDFHQHDVTANDVCVSVQDGSARGCLRRQRSASRRLLSLEPQVLLLPKLLCAEADQLDELVSLVARAKEAKRAILVARNMRQHGLGAVRGRAGLLAALACVFASATFFGTASDANAWYHFQTIGRPGQVGMVQVVAIDDAQYSTYGPYLTLMSNWGPVVYRSSSTRGPQNVLGIYQLERWNGSGWVAIVQQRTPGYRIARGRNAVRLPRLYRSPSIQTGYFRVLWAFGWTNARTGRVLGKTLIAPNRYSDFRCATPHRPCQSSSRWIAFGRAYSAP